MSKLSIGILGGVGAIASARFHLDLVTEWARVHEAKTDEDFPVIHHTSRSFGLGATGLDTPYSPSQEAFVRWKVNELFEHAVDRVAVVCNSLTPILPKDSRILTPVAACADKLKNVKRAWLLASDSTIRDRVYHNAYPHVEWLIPSVSLTAAIQASITGVFDLAMRLPDEDTVVLGCTELSTQTFIHPNVISPTDEMIRILCHELPSR